MSPLGNGAIVETQHPAESLHASNWAETGPGAVAGFDQSVVETLMIPLRVIMGDEVVGSPAERSFTEEDHAVKTLVFDRSDKSFGIGVQVGRARRQADHLDAGIAQETSESRRELRITVCVQQRLACSAGVSPAREETRIPVA